MTKSWDPRVIVNGLFRGVILLILSKPPSVPLSRPFKNLKSTKVTSS